MILPLAAQEASSSRKRYNFFKDQKTYIKNPFELRDPFRRNLEATRTIKKKRVGIMGENNVFTNLPSIEDVPINQIKVVGIMLGKERRAMAKVGDNKQIFILKEGMKLGVDNAEIKAILPGGIVLVEKIRNVYDQDEYLETIVPVSEN